VGRRGLSIAIVALVIFGVAFAGPASARAARTVVWCSHGVGGQSTESAPRSCVFHRRGNSQASEAYTTMISMRWTGWGRPKAKATGTALGNMDLRAKSYVVLSGRKACPGEHRQVYTHFHIYTPETKFGYGMALQGC
jgi:hypothetical protein